MTTENQLHDTLGDDLKAVGEQGAAALKEQAEAGKEKTAAQLEGLSDVIDQVASSLSEQDKEGIAGYVHDAAERLAGLAHRLQDRSMEQLTGDAKQLARNKPAVFMLGSVALGFGLTRFLRASAAGHGAGTQYRHEHGEGNRGGSFGSGQDGAGYRTGGYGVDPSGSDADYTVAAGTGAGDGEAPVAPGGTPEREAMSETARYSSAGS